MINYKVLFTKIILWILLGGMLGYSINGFFLTTPDEYNQYAEKGNSKIVGKLLDENQKPITRASVDCFPGKGTGAINLRKNGLFECEVPASADEYLITAISVIEGNTTWQIATKGDKYIWNWTKVKNHNTGTPSIIKDVNLILGEESDLGDNMLIGTYERQDIGYDYKTGTKLKADKLSLYKEFPVRDESIPFQTTYKDEFGKYIFSAVPNGEYTIRVGDPIYTDNKLVYKDCVSAKVKVYGNKSVTVKESSYNPNPCK